MNLDSILSDWTHPICFGLIAIVVVSLVAVVAGKLMQRQAVLKHSILLAALVGCLLVPAVAVYSGETGKPIPGISFWNSLDDKPGARSGVNSHPTFVDHPKSNEAGELRVIAIPGSRQYGVGWSDMPEGYRGGSGGRTVKCESGKMIRLTFELRKTK